MSPNLISQEYDSTRFGVFQEFLKFADEDVARGLAMRRLADSPLRDYYTQFFENLEDEARRHFSGAVATLQIISTLAKQNFPRYYQSLLKYAVEPRIHEARKLLNSVPTMEIKESTNWGAAA